ncbi:carbohydrate kinase family protein [Parasedimentitalea psychrophila]|uniref:Carbohydrate kinase n=1 Tax=Parasedimentitalea psychrophila TaxID=2997337 RepID=A0A9Y2NZS0_9RHOB|nr:carbohydrate kinase [Parasedimentitalea psychrophila]WIY23881.1 carbohydrate kinase [Parasedimentitalea psychrophila]
MILCCGEALIDMIPTPTQSGLDGFVPHSGGAVFNTAIALGRLGVKTGMLTGLSTDMFGAQLEASLTASRVDTSLVIWSDRPTTLAFVTLDDGQATYSFFDENSAGRMLAPSDIQPLSKNVTALFFGGISLICEPCAHAYVDLAARTACDKVVMLDPNIRPGFIKNIPQFRWRLERLISMADILKISDEDLDWIYPAPDTLAAKMTLLLKAGPSIVVLTKGAKGASAFTAAGHEVSVTGERVKVVDTVGAGDTFNAGFLAKLFDLEVVTKVALRQIGIDDVRAALTYGTRAAAITVSRAGANSPWVGEL